MTMDIVEKWRAFCRWQQQPPRLIKKSDELHRCFTCGEEYHGNYCPQCGQSARIGRYSFKNALLLFLDVWGVGNRGMFRTLRDLLLRPGYMIRDYISGMQMAYFPPFKLLFLLTALWTLVQSGVNLEGTNYLAERHERTVEKYGGQGEDAFDNAFNTVFYNLSEFLETKTAFAYLVIALLVTLPLYLFFRKSSNIPDMRFSEMVVTMVYITSLIEITAIILDFQPFSIIQDFNEVTLILPVVAMKQLSGFPWWKTILFAILSYAIALILAFLFISASIILLSHF